MNVKPGYKQTEVGVIPEEWEVVRLGNVANVKTGPFGSSLHESDYVRDGTPIITVEHLGDYGVEHSNLPLVSDTDRQRLRSYSLVVGDIVFSRVGSVDRNALIRHSEAGWLFSGRLLRVRPDKQQASAPFLSFQFHGEAFKRLIRNVAVGQTMACLNTQILKGIFVSLPPLPEQRAIATALSDVDGLLGGLDRLIAKKRDLKQAAMQQLLTGQIRLPGFAPAIQKFKKTDVGVIPEDWNQDYIEDFAHITTGSKNTQDRIQDGNYPFFVRSQMVERINSYSFDGEAVLTAGDGVGTGKVFHYINGKFDVHQRVYRISNFNESINGYFFYLYFSTHFYDRIMQMTAKSSVDSVRRDMIARMLVPLPPTITEQTAIAEVLTEMDAELAGLTQRRDKTRALKQAMMQELLTGRTRLIPESTTEVKP